MPTQLHRQRLDAVLAALRDGRASSVVDLGCGDGRLLERLLEEPQMRSAVGVDQDRRALARIAERVRGDERVSLVEASLQRPLPELGPVDAAVLVEVIEHLEPSRLHAVERSVFAELRPRLVVITTPNADFNGLLGVPEHRMRHPEHRFEWGRARFRAWCRGVAERNGYEATFRDVPAAHPHLGGPTQMAVFDRADGSTALEPPTPARAGAGAPPGAADAGVSRAALPTASGGAYNTRGRNDGHRTCAKP